MEIISTQKFVRTSPRKLRLIADAVRSMAPVTAVSVLAYSGKRASDPLSKVIKSALANATQQGFSQKDMIFKEIQISEGPRLKRGRPISRGMYHPIKKRMSHIRVALTLATASSSKTA
jgi:large subunit ribosomal protein L22